MAAQDGEFDEVIERVSASTNAPPAPGVYTLCVRGTDSGGNRGGPLCIDDLSVSLYYLGLSMLNRSWYTGDLPPNGDFESGLDYWVRDETFMPVKLVTENPLNRVDRTPDLNIPIGIGSAVVGNPDARCGPDLPSGPNVFAGLEQTIAIPRGSFSLQFKYVIYSQDIGFNQNTGTYYDTFEVYVNNERQFLDGNNVNELKCKWHRGPATRTHDRG